MRRVETFTRNRPFTAALVVFVLVVVPGFFRVEQIANQRADDRIERDTIRCEEEVERIDADRIMWLILFDELGSSDEVDAFRTVLDVVHEPQRCEGTMLVPDPGRPAELPPMPTTTNGGTP